MDFALRACRNCGADIFSNSARCIHCMQIVTKTNSLRKIFSGKTAIFHVTLALAASLAVSDFIRHLIDPTVIEAPSPAQVAPSTPITPEVIEDHFVDDSLSTQGDLRERLARDSVDEMTDTINANPRDYLAYEGRGWFRFKELGEGKLAVADLTTAIKLRPLWAQPYAERAWIYHFMGDDRKALRDAMYALRREHDNRLANDVVDAIRHSHLDK